MPMTARQKQQGEGSGSDGQGTKANRNTTSSGGMPMGVRESGAERGLVQLPWTSGRARKTAVSMDELCTQGKVTRRQRHGALVRNISLDPGLCMLLFQHLMSMPPWAMNQASQFNPIVGLFNFSLANDAQSLLLSKLPVTPRADCSHPLSNQLASLCHTCGPKAEDTVVDDDVPEECPTSILNAALLLLMLPTLKQRSRIFLIMTQASPPSWLLLTRNPAILIYSMQSQRMQLATVNSFFGSEVWCPSPSFSDGATIVGSHVQALLPLDALAQAFIVADGANSSAGHDGGAINPIISEKDLIQGNAGDKAILVDKSALKINRECCSKNYIWLTRGRLIKYMIETNKPMQVFQDDDDVEVLPKKGKGKLLKEQDQKDEEMDEQEKDKHRSSEEMLDDLGYNTTFGNGSWMVRKATIQFVKEILRPRGHVKE
ncbi:hypothetical protein L7F22_068421 [Adiantum nelumboides]|nr:hypothetical protein [Adiantum nelumboides]